LNLTGREPYQKQGHAKARPDYLEAVRGLPCIICQTWGETQTTPTEAHHPICDRHGTRKAPDVDALPVCHSHHTGDFDSSKIAIHRDRAAWVDAYGSDREYIAATQAMLAHIL
jgi:hypothetical protein